MTEAVPEELEQQQRTAVDAAAHAALAGINPVWFLHCDDALELRMLNAVAARVHELRQVEREQQAILIANKVGEMLGGR